MKSEYYIVIDQQKVPVTREVWQYHLSWTNHIYYEACRCEECWAGLRQMAVCDGDCYTCPCYTPKRISVDAPDNDLRVVMWRYRDPQMTHLCIEILADMARVDPDGERIGRMIMTGWSQADIAANVGLSVSTYRDRLRRIGQKLSKE